jgi:predicted small lipoprotein YifL
MKRLLHVLALLALSFSLAACGPQRQSVFPPTITIQQMRVQPDGAWQLSLRIQNNSYTGMAYQSIEGQWQVAQGIPVRVHAKFELEIPSFAADVVQVQVLPTPAMSQALKAQAAKGSAGSLPYTLSGTVHCTPNLEDHPDDKRPRDFPFNSNSFLSPVPGVPDTFR